MTSDVIVKNFIGKSEYISFSSPNDLVNQIKNHFDYYGHILCNNKNIKYLNDKDIMNLSTKDNIFIFRILINVKKQYDEPYNGVTNQCSWVSYEFIKNINDLVYNFNNNNMKDFRVIYEKCLMDGSKARKNNMLYPYGENIDQIGFESNFEVTEFGQRTEIMNDPIISSIITRPNYNYKKFDNFCDDIKNMSCSNILIINRDGQSFVVYKNYDNWIVFDSHISTVKEYEYDDIIKYIINDEQSYQYILHSFL